MEGGREGKRLCFLNDSLSSILFGLLWRYTLQNHPKLGNVLLQLKTNAPDTFGTLPKS